MKLFEFIWGGEEVTVNYTQEFLTADRMVQLDALVDAKALISDAYESLMEQAWSKQNDSISKT